MIALQKQAYSDNQIYNSLNELVGDWFRGKFRTFSEPQRYAVMNIHQRKNTLISAPTGSGKTLSAFLSILNELTSLEIEQKLENKIYCVYVSPLKALSNDIEKNLLEPLSEIRELKGKDLNIRVGVRTGDTTPYERTKMTKNPPHILITTPESLAILLTTNSMREKLKDVQWVITDEIHSLAENKRGTHLSLSFERLQNLAGEFTRIGLSATISPLDGVAQFLVGQDYDGTPRDCKIVDVRFLKKMDMQVLSPVKNIMNATHEQITNSMYRIINNLIQQHKTTLIFTNTRGGTERVVHHLKERFPKNYISNNEDLIGAHHSSLSKEHRLQLETKLKKGEMKAVVCSTSLELGIDIGKIDLVILLGSPKSIARAMQRVGRSGHKLQSKIKGKFIVLNRDDLVECAMILKNSVDSHIDDIKIPDNCLDVLAQQIYAFAIDGVIHEDVLFSTIKRSYPYRNLSKKDFHSVLNYLAGDYSKLENRNVYAKIWWDKNTKEIGKRGKLARVLYMTNVGTIPDQSFIRVKMGKNMVGKIDEAFLERLKKNDIFVLGGKTYRYKYARGMTVQVSPAPGRAPTVPTWVSESLPLSFDLGKSIQHFRGLMEEKFNTGFKKQEIVSFIKKYLYADDNAANSIYEYMKEQYLFSELPTSKKLLIEHVKYENRNYSIVHSYYGRRVNDALSRAVAYSIAKVKKRNVAITLADNGFILVYPGDRSWVREAIESLNKNNLKPILEKAITKTELLRRRFRYCAGRSLMILRNYKGRRKSAGRQQVSARILLKMAKELGKDFPILKEAKRETFEDLMDLKHAVEVVEDINKKQLEIKEKQLELPSPFSLNLLARGYTDILRFEEKKQFIRRLHNQILVKISLNEKNGIR